MHWHNSYFSISSWTWFFPVHLDEARIKGELKSEKESKARKTYIMYCYFSPIPNWIQYWQRETIFYALSNASRLKTSITHFLPSDLVFFLSKSCALWKCSLMHPFTVSYSYIPRFQIYMPDVYDMIVFVYEYTNAHTHTFRFCIPFKWPVSTRSLYSYMVFMLLGLKW